MDNFDLKKYLVENEITSNAKNVKEGWEEEEEAYFADEPKYLRDEKGLWKEYDKTSNLEKGTLVKFYTLTYDRRQKEDPFAIALPYLKLCFRNPSRCSAVLSRPRSHEVMIRCPVLETGRYSVIPSTMPRIHASNGVMALPAPCSRPGPRRAPPLPQATASGRAPRRPRPPWDARPPSRARRGTTARRHRDPPACRA